jgi:hypothetical protein
VKLNFAEYQESEIKLSNQLVYQRVIGFTRRFVRAEYPNPKSKAMNDLQRDAQRISHILQNGGYDYDGSNTSSGSPETPLATRPRRDVEALSSGSLRKRSPPSFKKPTSKMDATG